MNKDLPLCTIIKVDESIVLFCEVIDLVEELVMMVPNDKHGLAENIVLQISKSLGSITFDIK